MKRTGGSNFVRMPHASLRSEANRPPREPDLRDEINTELEQGYRARRNPRAAKLPRHYLGVLSEALGEERVNKRFKNKHQAQKFKEFMEGKGADPNLRASIEKWLPEFHDTTLQGCKRALKVAFPRDFSEKFPDLEAIKHFAQDMRQKKLHAESGSEALQELYRQRRVKNAAAEKVLTRLARKYDENREFTQAEVSFYASYMSTNNADPEDEGQAETKFKGFLERLARPATDLLDPKYAAAKERFINKLGTGAKTRFKEKDFAEAFASFVDCLIQKDWKPGEDGKAQKIFNGWHKREGDRSNPVRRELLSASERPDEKAAARYASDAVYRWKDPGGAGGERTPRKPLAARRATNISPPRRESIAAKPPLSEHERQIRDEFERERRMQPSDAPFLNQTPPTAPSPEAADPSAKSPEAKSSPARLQERSASSRDALLGSLDDFLRAALESSKKI